MLNVWISLYTNPNFKLGVLKELKYSQRTDLLSEVGAAFSNDFKTSATYGYQPVLMNTVENTP